jgi:hypothetical protein
MTTIQYQPPQQPKENKSTTTTAFHYDGTKESPHSKDGTPLT